MATKCRIDDAVNKILIPDGIESDVEDDTAEEVWDSENDLDLDSNQIAEEVLDFNAGPLQMEVSHAGNTKEGEEPGSAQV